VFELVKIDVDDNAAIADDYEVRSIPTLVLKREEHGELER